MSYFRKKPVVIEARQFTSLDDELDAWITAKHIFVASPAPYMPGDLRATLHIETLEGTMVAHPADWIIKGVQGEFYPCKPDIFEATYEPCEETSSASGSVQPPATTTGPLA